MPTVSMVTVFINTGINLIFKSFFRDRRFMIIFLIMPGIVFQFLLVTRYLYYLLPATTNSKQPNGKVAIEQDFLYE